MCSSLVIIFVFFVAKLFRIFHGVIEIAEITNSKSQIWNLELVVWNLFEI